MGISGDYWSTFLNVDVDRTMYPADCYTPNTPETRPGRKGYLVNSVNGIIKIHQTNQSIISLADIQLLNVRKFYQIIITRKGKKVGSFSFTIASVCFFPFQFHTACWDQFTHPMRTPILQKRKPAGLVLQSK